jgi:hypothetical protein
LERTPLENYNLGAKFCREILKGSGASIFVLELQGFINVKNLAKNRILRYVQLKFIYQPQLFM